MRTNPDAEPALDRENPPLHGLARSSQPPADTALEFGRFHVLVRQRQLIADGKPIDLGTRAFDLLLALLEADGALLTKDELLSRVWPGVFVAEDNLKSQIFALRKALGDDRHFIRTEFGRGYRFTAVIRSTAPEVARHRPIRPRRRASQDPLRNEFPRGDRTVRVSGDQAGRCVAPAGWGAVSRADRIGSAT